MKSCSIFTKIYAVVLISSILSITIKADDSAFEWKDPISGNRFNFESLKRDYNNPWQVKDGADNGLFSMVYLFNFGQDNSKKCKGQAVTVSEVLEVLKQPTDTCEILGHHNQKTVGLIENNDPNKGIWVQYAGGDVCQNGDNPAENGKPRKTKFKLICAPRQDDNFVLDLPHHTQGSTKCTLEFKINTPAGCPSGAGSFKSSTVLLWIVFIFGLYFGLGTVYNIKARNLDGKEALPHIDFWRSFPAMVQDGASYSIRSISNFVGFVRQRVSKSNSAYNSL